MKIICYLSNGYPTIEKSCEIASEYVDGGCDIIEIDFPSREPYLESEYIANRMEEALNNCDDYNKYMEGIIAIKKKHINTRFIIMIYEETVNKIGIDTFIKFCLDNDIIDIILVGFENENVKNNLIEKGLKVSCYVQYHLLDQEIEFAKKSNGFVYLQAKPTNGLTHEKYKTLSECIAYLRGVGIDRPIYCGVGIHTLDDMKYVKSAGADGAFVGSVILKLQDNISLMKETIAKFKAQC